MKRGRKQISSEKIRAESELYIFRCMNMVLRAYFSAKSFDGFSHKVQKRERFRNMKQFNIFRNLNLSCRVPFTSNP